MYKALISFSGVISMSCGEVGEIADPAVAKDLLRAGYIEEVKKDETESKPKPKRTKKKTP